MQCECSDPGCKAHKGESECHKKGTCVAYRIDMEDKTGTLFCETCADDAFDSGLFTSEIDNEEGEL